MEMKLFHYKIETNEKYLFILYTYKSTVGLEIFYRRGCRLPKSEREREREKMLGWFVVRSLEPREISARVRSPCLSEGEHNHSPSYTPRTITAPIS